VLYRSIPILAVPRFVNNQSLNSNIHDLSEYNADVFSNRFANLTYVYFTDSNDSPTSNVVSSQELVSNLIYILMKSQFWNSSAILLTHNEAGGWYDHVKPPMNNNTGEISGFRVPAIIISPYAKKSYIDSNIHDIRSFLDLVQSSFGIQRNTSFANHTNDISEVFNFEQQPRNPLFLQEVLKERIIVQPEEIEWINVIYIASPVLPFIVTLYWYFMKRRSKNAR
jgi:phospholipase C